jgi:hypothetical protein
VADGTDARLTFVQRWKSARYADHGEKVLVLRAGKIVREELSASVPGWQDDAKQVFDARALPTALTLRLVARNDSTPNDCQYITYVLYVGDKKREIGTALRRAKEEVEEAIAPQVGGGKILYDDDAGCDQAMDRVTIVRNGDSLVVKTSHRDFMPEAANDPPRPPEVVLTVLLPARAVLKAE